METLVLTDQDLLSLIKNGEPYAFEVIFERYWDQLFKTAVARLNNEDDAKDIVQELLISFWNKREKLAIKTTIENYLFGALKLSIISHFRTEKVCEIRLEDAIERISILEDSVTDIEDYLELEHVLEEAVSLMPETLRSIYILRCDNVPVKEIALKLGLADQTVKNYIAEVIRRLRTVITKKYPEKHLTYLVVLMHLLNK
jgi:RNA polymerase sigma factor (sigma-70 family)